MIQTSFLNLTIYNLLLRNTLRGPFITANSCIQLSVFQSQIFRFSNSFIYTTFGQINISYSHFKQGLEAVFTLGNNNLLSEQSNTGKKFSDPFFIPDLNYIFFGCCSFNNAAVIWSEFSNPSVKIKRCQFNVKIQDYRLICLPYNEQLIIEDSFFLIESANKGIDKGLFILSEPLSTSYKSLLSQTPLNLKFLLDNPIPKTNLLSYFSIQRSFFGFDTSMSYEGTRDTIASTALYHDINYINMTNINLLECKWGCCLGINTETMIRITFSNFINNSGDNLIWIMNLPDRQHQKISNNCIFSNNAEQLLFIDKDIYIEDCVFSSNDFNNSTIFGRFNNAIYTTSNIIITTTIRSLIFDFSQFTDCSYLEPTSTLTPPKSMTPTPPKRTLSTVYTASPSMTPTETPTPARTDWPARSPMPSSTPTATPPYVPIAGITSAVVFALCIIIFLIVFFCREYRHKSSEDTVDDNNVNVNLSGLGERSCSSETDPLNLNTSDDDSFDL